MEHRTSLTLTESLLEEIDGDKPNPYALCQLFRAVVGRCWLDGVGRRWGLTN